MKKPVVLAKVKSFKACRLICKTYFDKIEKEYDGMKIIAELSDHVPYHVPEFKACEANEEDVDMNLAVQRVLRRNNRVNYNEDSDEDEVITEAHVEEVANFLLQLADGVEE